MEDLDLEQQEPFPVDRNGRRLGDAADQPDGGRPAGCCERFQLSVSKWMLPEDHREKYLERANCCPPPIFIVLISIAEVAVADRSDPRGFRGLWSCSLRLCYLMSGHICCDCVWWM